MSAACTLAAGTAAAALLVAGCGGKQETEDDQRADDHDAGRDPQGRGDAAAGREVVRPVGDLPARVAGRRDDHQHRPRQPERQRAGQSGVGSGFVISGNGEIATNAHVVTSGEGASIHKARAGLRALQGQQPGPGRDRRLRPVLRRRAAEGRSRRPDAPAAAARLRRATCMSARRSRRSAARSARSSRCRSASSPRSTARSTLSPASRRRARSRPTRRSTTATRAARCSTRAGACSGSTPRSRPPAATAAASASRCRSTRSSARSTSCARTARSTTRTSASRPRRCIRSSPSTSRLGTDHGAWVQDTRRAARPTTRD